MLAGDAEVHVVTCKTSGASDTLVELSYEGRLHLDKLDGCSFQLTDIVTSERVKITGEGWSLVVDEDGSEACLARCLPGGEPEVQHIDQLMQRLVFVSSDSGERFVKIGHGQGRKIYSLDKAMTSYKTGTLGLQVGPTSARLSLKVHVFQRPRGGNLRAFFDLHDVYRALRMSACKGVPSKWVWHSMQTWTAYFVSLGLGVQLVRSTSVADDDDDPWSQRCLPATCASSAALLLLLGRWAFLSRERGGLSSSEQREAAGEIFGRLCDAALEGVGLRLRVSLVVEWRCRWPRPAVLAGEVTVDVCISAGGEVDFRSLAQLASCPGPHRAVAKHTMAALSLTGALCRSSVAQVFACASKASARAVVGQIALSIAAALEVRMGQMAMGKDSAVASGMSFRWLSMVESIQWGYQLDEKLARYMQSCVAACLHQTMITLATDKHSGCGVPLQNTIICLPSGTAMLCPPQVFGGLSRGRGGGRFVSVLGGFWVWTSRHGFLWVVDKNPLP